MSLKETFKLLLMLFPLLMIVSEVISESQEIDENYLSEENLRAFLEGINSCCEMKLKGSTTEDIDGCSFNLKTLIKKNPYMGFFFLFADVHLKNTVTRILMNEQESKISSLFQKYLGIKALKAEIHTMVQTKIKQALPILKGKYIDPFETECKRIATVFKDNQLYGKDEFPQLVSIIAFVIVKSEGNLFNNFLKNEKDDKKIKAFLRFPPYYIQSLIASESLEYQQELLTILSDETNTQIIFNDDFGMTINTVQQLQLQKYRVCKPSFIMTMLKNTQIMDYLALYNDASSEASKKEKLIQFGNSISQAIGTHCLRSSSLKGAFRQMTLRMFHLQ